MEGTEDRSMPQVMRIRPTGGGLSIAPADWRQGLVVALLAMVAAAALVFLAV